MFLLEFPAVQPPNILSAPSADLHPASFRSLAFLSLSLSLSWIYLGLPHLRLVEGMCKAAQAVLDWKRPKWTVERVKAACRHYKEKHKHEY